MIISISGESHVIIFNIPFMINTPRKLGIDGNFLNLIKSIYTKIPTANILLNGKRQDCPPKRGNLSKYFTFQFSVSLISTLIFLFPSLPLLWVYFYLLKYLFIPLLFNVILRVLASVTL